MILLWYYIATVARLQTLAVLWNRMLSEDSALVK